MIWREHQLQKAIAKYQGLKLVPEGSGITVAGTLEAAPGFDFEIVIRAPKSSWSFPSVEEIGGRIPRLANRHVNSDGTLCMAVRPSEIAICKKGLEFGDFIDRILIPHLAREIVREEKGRYPQGEYSHYEAGIWEYFEDFFGMMDREKVHRLIEISIDSSGVDPYSDCLCGSQKKFKFCHLPKCTELREIGKDNLRTFLHQLKPNEL